MRMLEERSRPEIELVVCGYAGEQRVGKRADGKAKKLVLLVYIPLGGRRQQ